MTLTTKALLLWLCGSLWLCGEAQVYSVHNLMPVPAELKTTGDALRISGEFRVSVRGANTERMYAEASRFVRRLSEQTGIFLDKQGFVGRQDTSASATLLIRVQRAGRLEVNEDESYTLSIHDTQAVLHAATDIGAIRGLETLLQLVSTDTAGYYFPGVSISDRPRFAWRGLLMDVALHFMPVDVIYRTLDGMAAVKMNVLHLHLSNDQGFRVESKVFPQLQRVASDGKYYTQQQIKQIIAYAGQRGIRIVPEFVMPAHTTAILTAFPSLASAKRAYTLQRYFGVFDPVLDPTNEQVWTFLGKLLGEMTALFPDKYFHIGGDENTGKDWESNSHIRAYMKTHGMTTYMALQTAFNQRLLPIITKYHKTMMGWDEILQPGVPKNIVIQSWRGKEAFYQSVKEGHQAILSNGYYIDLIQPASFHYLNDPIPDSVSLTTEEKNNILGGEATMWSEMVTPETVDSRIWPRTAAIAERLWSPANVKDTDDMYRRLDVISLHLEALGLRHQLYQQEMLRRLVNGYNIQPLTILIDVIEPLKIYERNEGDTMYTVFSPFTKIADAAIPDPPLPRHFRKLVNNFLSNPSAQFHDSIVAQLTTWKNNHAAFMKLIANSPVLREAVPLSDNLSKLSQAGLEAIELISSHMHRDRTWLTEKLQVLQNARQQSGRCELQVVEPVERLVNAAAAGR